MASAPEAASEGSGIGGAGCGLPADLLARLRQHQTTHAERAGGGKNAATVKTPEAASTPETANTDTKETTTTRKRSRLASRSDPNRRRGASVSGDDDGGFSSSSPDTASPGHARRQRVEDQTTGENPFGSADFMSFNKDEALRAAAATHGVVSSLARRRGGREVTRHVPLWSVRRFETAGGYAADPLVALHEEITDLCDYLRPTEAEVTLRRLVELQISDIAKRLWPECEPCVYGSMSTGLLLPLSDIDISLLNVPVSPEEALTTLAREVATAQLCTDLTPQLILKTKVPLVKFLHRLVHVDVDLSVNAGDGKVNTELVCRLCDEYPESRPLITAVKYFLQQREMHEPFRGGLGSFATTLLVISFLQHHPIYTNPATERCNYGLGKLLVDFFFYYSRCFNYQRVGISLRDGGNYFMKPPSPPIDPNAPPQRQPPQMIIEDPGNEANNVASSLRNFHNIITAFDHAHMALTAKWPSVPDGDERVSPGSALLAHRPTLLSRILHGDVEMAERRLRMAQSYDDLAANERPEAMARIHDYRAAEDKILLDPTLRVRVAPRVFATTAPSSSVSSGFQQHQKEHSHRRLSQHSLPGHAQGPSSQPSQRQGSFGGGGGAAVPWHLRVPDHYGRDGRDSSHHTSDHRGGGSNRR